MSDATVSSSSRVRLLHLPDLYYRSIGTGREQKKVTRYRWYPERFMLSGSSFSLMHMRGMIVMFSFNEGLHKHPTFYPPNKAPLSAFGYLFPSTFAVSSTPQPYDFSIDIHGVFLILPNKWQSITPKEASFVDTPLAISKYCQATRNQIVRENKVRERVIDASVALSDQAFQEPVICIYIERQMGCHVPPEGSRRQFIAHYIKASTDSKKDDRPSVCFVTPEAPTVSSFNNVKRNGLLPSSIAISDDMPSNSKEHRSSSSSAEGIFRPSVQFNEKEKQEGAEISSVTAARGLVVHPNDAEKVHGPPSQPNIPEGVWDRDTQYPCGCIVALSMVALHLLGSLVVLVMPLILEITSQ
ncbi:MAG: hypothetical protein M1827_004881 [Pycnora praestabilis]|nr:MAG: hypothetical protein M1827_004881 [Pycnora praestabilis]